MPRFYRNSRQLLRLFLVLVLAMALFGGWYADRNWRPSPEDLQLTAITEEVDWLTLTSDLVEDGIDVFQTMTGR